MSHFDITFNFTTCNLNCEASCGLVFDYGKPLLTGAAEYLQRSEGDE